MESGECEWDGGGSEWNAYGAERGWTNGWKKRVECIRGGESEGVCELGEYVCVWRGKRELKMWESGGVCGGVCFGGRCRCMWCCVDVCG